MQVIYKNEDERGRGRGADSVGTIICAGRIGGCMKGKHTGGSGREIVGVQNSW